jgi:pilus assembly protein CpaB
MYTAAPMNRRALVIALIAALLGATLLLLYLRRFEQEASGGERIKLLMAIKPIERGTVLTNEMLASREVPLAYVEDRAIKASEKAKVVGLRVGNAVQPQQTLLWTDLAIATDERRDLSSLVQPGNRALSVKAHGDDKSYALIHPGDYVDVIATMPTAGGSGEGRSAMVLLQKVLVLAVGLETASEQLAEKTEGPRANREMLLTLSVNLQEAQLLSLATEKGKLSVALRNPDDQRVVEGIVDMSSTTLTDTKARAEVQNIRKGPVRLKSVSGDKQ